MKVTVDNSQSKAVRLGQLAYGDICRFPSGETYYMLVQTKQAYVYIKTTPQSKYHGEHATRKLLNLSTGDIYPHLPTALVIKVEAEVFINEE